MTERGLVPVVGKSLEAVIVLLYVAALVTTLHGGVLPDYRTATAAELSDRTLASTADRVEATVPPRSTAVDVTQEVEIPAAIDGATYRIRAANGTLVLAHPDDDLSGRLDLALPDRVSVTGSWESDDRTVLRIRGTTDRIRVVLA